ncbi:uncharacterized protein LOC113471983 [Diaphorina citri]|uniref:Uncharacterized protein LOC113471983 n=1 Tax=Diaphorina citri TaxID=121845 RepID=A0A3Q0JFR3_DIACI|nr:uncharacterized protein LOC113471983 [Diaphorina citri]
MNLKKTKLMLISKTPKNNVNLTIDGVPIDKVSSYKYLGTWLHEDNNQTKEIRCRIEIARHAFIKMKKCLCSRDINLKLRTRILKCYVFSTLLYGAEVWTLKKNNEKNINAFEMWCYRRMLRIPWTDKVTNVEVLRRMDKIMELEYTIKKKKLEYLGHILRGPKYKLLNSICPTFDRFLSPYVLHLLSDIGSRSTGSAEFNSYSEATSLLLHVLLRHLRWATSTLQAWIHPPYDVGTLTEIAEVDSVLRRELSALVVNTPAVTNNTRVTAIREDFVNTLTKDMARPITEDLLMTSVRRFASLSSRMDDVLTRELTTVQPELSVGDSPTGEVQPSTSSTQPSPAVSK